MSETPRAPVRVVNQSVGMAPRSRGEMAALKGYLIGNKESRQNLVDKSKISTPLKEFAEGILERTKGRLEQWREEAQATLEKFRPDFGRNSTESIGSHFDETTGNKVLTADEKKRFLQAEEHRRLTGEYINGATNGYDDIQNDTTVHEYINAAGNVVSEQRDKSTKQKALRDQLQTRINNDPQLADLKVNLDAAVAKGGTKAQEYLESILTDPIYRQQLGIEYKRLEADRVDSTNVRKARDAKEKADSDYKIAEKKLDYASKASAAVKGRITAYETKYAGSSLSPQQISATEGDTIRDLDGEIATLKGVIGNKKSDPANIAAAQARLPLAQSERASASQRKAEADTYIQDIAARPTLELEEQQAIANEKTAKRSLTDATVAEKDAEKVQLDQENRLVNAWKGATGEALKKYDEAYMSEFNPSIDEITRNAPDEHAATFYQSFKKLWNKKNRKWWEHQIDDKKVMADFDKLVGPTPWSIDDIIKSYMVDNDAVINPATKQKYTDTEVGDLLQNREWAETVGAQTVVEIARRRRAMGRIKDEEFDTLEQRYNGIWEAVVDRDKKLAQEVDRKIANRKELNLVGPTYKERIANLPKTRRTYANEKLRTLNTPVEFGAAVLGLIAAIGADEEEAIRQRELASHGVSR